MSMALRSGKAYPREAHQAGAQGPHAVQTDIYTDPVNRRSYSDVVRSGSPSQDEESGKRSDVAYSRRPRSVSELNVGKYGRPIEDLPLSWDAGTTTEADTQWKKVWGKGKKKGNTSTPSICSIASSNRFEHLPINKISVVEETELKMTAAELNLFKAQMKSRKVPTDQLSQSSDIRAREPGPSKGKGIDPRNFGGLDISGSEMDPDEQREAFVLWNQVKRMQEQEDGNKKGGRSRSRKTSPPPSIVSENWKHRVSSDGSMLEHSDYEIVSNHDKSKCKRTPNLGKRSGNEKRVRSSSKDCTSEACRSHKIIKCEPDSRRSHSVLKPIQQLNKSSYLGKILENVGKPSKKKKKRQQSESDSSDPPSLEGASTSSSESSESPDSDDGPIHWSGRTGTHKPERNKSHGMKLKPIPPEIYDGTPDPQIFHKFLTQVQNYMEDGRVPPEKQVYRLADFLKGRAYKYYLSRVGRRPDKTTLSRCLRGLFNHCFPVDFRSQLRLKLKRCHQGDRKIREFIFELEELSTMIGGVDKRELVNRLWFGCNKAIRAQLYLMNLHPEVSSFKRVKKAVEIVEMALSVEGNHSSNYRKDAPPPQTKNLEGKNKGGTHQNNKGNGRNTRLNSVSSNSAQPKGRDDANKKGSPGKGKPTPKLSPK